MKSLAGRITVLSALLVHGHGPSPRRPTRSTSAGQSSPSTTSARRRRNFAVLSHNPLTIDRTRIADIKVVETIKKGQSIYRRDPKTVSDDSPLCIDSPRCYQRFVAFGRTGR